MKLKGPLLMLLLKMTAFGLKNITTILMKTQSLTRFRWQKAMFRDLWEKPLWMVI
jgi:hypothetical protein